MSLGQQQMSQASSTVAWKIPWTEEPGGLQSMGSLRIGHNWATSLSLFTFMHWRREWQPTPVFLPGESQGRGSLVGCRHGVAQSQTRLKRLNSNSLFSLKRLCLFPDNQVLLAPKIISFTAWWVLPLLGAPLKNLILLEAAHPPFQTGYPYCDHWLIHWSSMETSSHMFTGIQLLPTPNRALQQSCFHELCLKWCSCFH